MADWSDPDDPRQWWLIVPLLLVALGFGIYIAIEGAWLMLAIAFAVSAFALYGQWHTGKPLWPGGPRRH